MAIDRPPVPARAMPARSARRPRPRRRPQRTRRCPSVGWALRLDDRGPSRRRQEHSYQHGDKSHHVTNDQPETGTTVAVHEPAAPTKATSEEHELEHHGIDADEGQVGGAVKAEQEDRTTCEHVPDEGDRDTEHQPAESHWYCGAIACIDTGGAIGNGG